MQKAIAYIRVSTAGQVEDGVSLDAQRARIAAWATANNFELVAVFEDAGLSGSRADNRPGLTAALDAVCRARGALVVHSLSRLARSVKDTLCISERLERADADLVSLTERIDTTTAAGRMVFAMLAAMNQFERDLASERTKAALTYKKGRGERVGQVPFGSRLAEDGVSLVPDPAEQEAIALVAELRARGQSCRAIATEMNRRGIPTKGGGKWYETTARRVLAAA